jgi:hypothetical protein
MGTSKKIRKKMAGKFTKRQKDYVKKGNKAFDCLLKEADSNILVRVPARIGRKTAMFSATIVIRFILVLILEFIQVQMLTKPEPLHSFYTTESHVSTEALNTVRAVLSKPGPVKTKFDEVYALTGGAFKQRVKGFFYHFYDLFPTNYTDPETHEEINVQELLSGIYQKMIEIIGDSGKIPGLLIKNMDGIFALINTLIESAIAKNTPNISAKDLLEKTMEFNQHVGNFAESPQMQELVPLLKKHSPSQYGGGASKQAKDPAAKGADSNAIVCAIKAIFFSSPVILVVSFIINFTLYTIGKGLELGLQSLLDSTKKNVEGVTLPKIDQLLNPDYAISSRAFLQLFDSMLEHKDKIHRIVSSFTGFIDALQGMIDSFIEMYNEKVPESIKNMVLKYFVKMLQIIDSLESAPEMGLDTLLNLLLLVNSYMDEADPEKIEQFFDSMTSRLKTMTSQLPTDTQVHSLSQSFPLSSGSFGAPLEHRGGGKRHRNRNFIGGNINKSIREFYSTNRIHRKTNKHRY